MIRRRWGALAGLGVALLALAGAIVAGGAAAQPRPDASAALIRATDLPAGWTPVDLSDLDLDTIDPAEFSQIMPEELGLNPAGRCAMALAPLSRALAAQPPSFGVSIFRRSELGPFLAHVVLVVPPGVADLIASLANPAASNAIADACRDELMAAGMFDPAELDFPELEEIGFSMQVTPLKVAPIGDQVSAQRVDVTIGFLGTALIGITSTRGNAVSMLFLLTDPNSATTSVGMMEQLARTADQRLQQVLGGR